MEGARDMRPVRPHRIVTHAIADAHALQQLAINIQLKLAVGSVTYTHRPRAAIAINPFDITFWRRRSTVYIV